MGIETIRESGSHKQISPINLSQINRLLECVEITIAQLEGCELESF